MFQGKAFRTKPGERNGGRTATWPSGNKGNSTLGIGVYGNQGDSSHPLVSPAPSVVTTFNGTDREDSTCEIKYISLVSNVPSAGPKSVSGSDSGDSQTKSVQNSDFLPKVKLINSLPMRASLQRSKQIPGRFFPAPSLSEDQKVFLQVRRSPISSAPTKQLSNKIHSKKRQHAGSGFYVQTGASLTPRTPARTPRSKSCDIELTNKLYPDIYDEVANSDIGNEYFAHNNSSMTRHSSIPVDSLFKNVLTGTPKAIHTRTA